MTGIASPSANGRIYARAIARAAPVGGLVAFAYFVLVGGTAWGDIDPLIRVLNGAVAAGFIVVLAAQAGRSADRIDIAAIVAVCLFSLAGVLSAFPRQSLDAVLAALAYAATFYAARGVLAVERSRRLFVLVLASLSLVITLITARYWLLGIVEWWARTDWQVAPSLTFELGAYPWGHRYDLALLVAMLYPAWWAGRPALWRRAIGIVLGMLALLIIVVSGSRTVWIALAAATFAVLLLHVRLGRTTSHRARLVLAGVLVFAVAGLVATGVVGVLFERALSVATLDWRMAMWQPLTEAWLASPLAGGGPGSFPWLLQPTGYFDTNSWAPRHPDNAAVQLIGEAGLLGVIAVVVLLAAIGPAIARSRSPAAQWAIVVFGVASLAANPTDFPFLVVTALGWVAYAAPRERRTGVPAQPRVGWPRLAALGCLGIVAVAYGATVVGSFAYERARSAISEGRMQSARSELDTAVAADPAMALYRRQRGTIHLIEGDTARAVSDLSHAAALSPSDDLAWRTLAIAHDADRNDIARELAIATALAVQRSDPTNLLLDAAWKARDGDVNGAKSALAEVVQAWPTTVFSEGWTSVMPSSLQTSAVVDEALERWILGSPMPERPGDQGVWLAAMSGREPPPADLRSPLSPSMSEILLSAVRCDPETSRAIGNAPLVDRRSGLYWLLRVRTSIVAGDPDRDAARMAGLMGYGLDPGAVGATLNPLNENTVLSLDAWGYRRRSIDWPSTALELPSPSFGFMRWLLRPSEATASAGIEGSHCADG